MSGTAPEMALGLARFAAVRVATDLRGAPLTRALSRRCDETIRFRFWRRSIAFLRPHEFHGGNPFVLREEWHNLVHPFEIAREGAEERHRHSVLDGLALGRRSSPEEPRHESVGERFAHPAHALDFVLLLLHLELVGVELVHHFPMVDEPVTKPGVLLSKLRI